MKITTQALLFDNDGTLVSSMDSVVRCWSRWAREERVTAEAFAAVQLHGRTAVAIIRDLLPEDRVAAAVLRIEELELADADGVVVLPGTLALLGSLPAGRWAVVTSATGRLGAARLAAAAIDPPLLISADDVTNGKPDPEPFLLAARKLGVRPEDCTVFEDAPAGLTAGRAAGMRTVALATTYAVEELDADVVVPDLSAVSVQVTDAGLEIITTG